MDEISTLMVSIIKTEQIKEEFDDWEEWQSLEDEHEAHEDSMGLTDCRRNKNVPVIKRENLAQENKSNEETRSIILENKNPNENHAFITSINEAKQQGKQVLPNCKHDKPKIMPENSLHPAITYPFSCHVCEKPYFRRGFLEKHFKKHLADLKCKKCKKSFDNFTIFKKHLLCQSKVKHCKCTKLQGKSKKSALKKPIKIHPEVNEQTFKCNKCNKMFTNRQVFDRHTLTHSAQKLHKCGVCKREFTYSDVYKRHLLIHTNIYPFECTVCNKRFRQQSTLNKHYRVHSGLKPYKCKICEISFSQSSSLTRHCLRHTGEKAFKCAECGRGFTRKGHIRDHILLVHNFPL